MITNNICQASLIKSALVSILRQENAPSDLMDLETVEMRNLLGNMLIASDQDWKEETLNLIDQIWNDESSSITKLVVDQIPCFDVESGTEVLLWQGDITRLQGDTLAIVNAANDEGLGCFVPHHRCIDNVIHRQAGPRLRRECHYRMNQRGSKLNAGTEPIVTDAYHLPCRHVIHVTGPRVNDSEFLTNQDQLLLSKAYKLSMDTAASTPGVKVVAFPCISTGIYGFPQEEAAEIAIDTVYTWLKAHPRKLDKVIFNVFMDKDYFLYQKGINSRSSFSGATEEPGTLVRTTNVAKTWIDDADAVLICAGAGMSVKDGEMVYTNAGDFAKHYPWFTKWGYNTSYETMSLGQDGSVPLNAKWALYAKHMDNMRWSFTPNEGYTELLKLVGKKDYFVLTSNVDGCFERSGFDKNRIYTPQGEWTYVQCMDACKNDSVYESRPYLDGILPHIDNAGFIPENLVPFCPRCGSQMFGNVHGGSWFLHSKYDEQNKALQTWMNDHMTKGSKIAVIEIGAGFNTPTVTRFPMEAFAREIGDKARFIRINPSEPEVPEDITAIAFKEGWQVLKDINRSKGIARKDMKKEEVAVKKYLLESNLVIPKLAYEQYTRYLGHFNWRNFLKNLVGH